MTIRELRERDSVSQSALAMKLGVSLATMQRWEYGSHEPSASQLARLAETFGVLMDDIEIAEPTRRTKVSA